MNVWVPIMLATQFGLMFIEIIGINTFGYLISLFGLAAITLSIAISNMPNVPYLLNIVSWILGWAQVLMCFIVVVFGKKALSGRGRR